jgi:glucose/arabinose dehydrogenase
MKPSSLLLFALLPGSFAAAQALPPDFEVVPVVSGLVRPVGLTFAPDGALLFIEQRGIVRYHDGAALQAAPLLDLRGEVNNNWDRGLLGITLHPGWTPDGGPTSWVYLLYTVSPVPGQDLAFDEDGKYSFSRLTRYKAVTSGSDVVGDLSSRHVLIGNQLPDGSVPDGIASIHNSHSNGSLLFAADGSLLVTTGDGAHWDLVDYGGNDPEGFDDFTHPVTGLKGPTPAVQDSGSFRSQDPRSLAGKVLRIDPETGHGYPSNPFFAGDATKNRAKVWALGLRNPFRAVMLPGTGATDPALGQPNPLAIADVGDLAWEEMNVVQGGENLGWPCFEGFGPKASFHAFDPPAPAFPNCNTATTGTPTDPILSWHHFLPGALKPAGVYVDEQGNPLPGFTGSCAIGGALYAGGPYPDLYDGRIFFADWASGWIKTIELDASHALVAVRPFATGMGQVTALSCHPVTGDLYLVHVYDGTVTRIRYVEPDPATPYGCGVNPAGSLALASPTVQVGAAVELTVHNPLGTQSSGAATALGVAVAPDPAYPCGTPLAGFGMAGPGALGELLLAPPPAGAMALVPGPPWTGAPTAVSAAIPFAVELVGATIHVQGVIVDPTFGGGGGVGVGLTDALALLMGS